MSFPISREKDWTTKDICLTCWQEDVFSRIILQSFFLRVVKDMAKVSFLFRAVSAQYNHTLGIFQSFSKLSLHL